MFRWNTPAVFSQKDVQVRSIFPQRVIRDHEVILHKSELKEPVRGRTRRDLLQNSNQWWHFRNISQVIISAYSFILWRKRFFWRKRNQFLLFSCLMSNSHKMQTNTDQIQITSLINMCSVANRPVGRSSYIILLTKQVPSSFSYCVDEIIKKHLQARGNATYRHKALKSQRSLHSILKSCGESSELSVCSFSAAFRQTATIH